MVLEGGILFHNRYKLLKKLGFGGFGEVWLADDTKMGKNVAIKIYIALNGDGLEDFKIEIKNTYDLNHPNLIHANHFDDCEGRPYLVMPYCSKGSAMGLPEAVDETTVWRFIRDVANGLAYLHNRKKPVIHQDIKPENILIDDDDNFLITDFGISKELKYSMSQQSERDNSGTKAYMGPERFSKTPITIKASDIFSLGVSAYYIVMGIMPFAGQGGAMLNIGAEIPDIDTDKYSEELNITIGACMVKETWERPTAEELAEYANAHLKGKTITPPWKIRLGKNNDNVPVKSNPDLNKTQVNVKFDEVPPSIPNNKIKQDSENIKESKIPEWHLFDGNDPKRKQILSNLIDSMIFVEGGTYWMGAQSTDPNGRNYDPDAKKEEAPVHQEVVGDFYIGMYLVTKAQWQAVIWDNPSKLSDSSMPIKFVSWEECQKFIRKLRALTGLNFGLPTEAQWEYAARGGNKSMGYKYSGSNDIKKVAVYNRFLKPKIVGAKFPNELGVYDMSGNVREWCRDRWLKYDHSAYDKLKYRAIPSTNNVYRGGCWFNKATHCRVSARGSMRGSMRNGIGLRLVLNIN